MLQEKDYFGKWMNHPEVTEQVRKNARVLISKVSELMSAFGEELTVTSGFRPHSYNAQIGGSKNSPHTTGEAIDLWDPDKKFGEWCIVNVNWLQQLGVYMESPVVTHASEKPSGRWIHLQIRKTRSGSTIFLP